MLICLRYTSLTWMVHSSKEPEWFQHFKNVKSFKIERGSTRLCQFEWSRLNSLLPIVEGMVLIILMIIKLGYNLPFCFLNKLAKLVLLCRGQDWLRVWILFPDWNIKHDQCKAKMINFYFDHVVLAKYKY